MSLAGVPLLPGIDSEEAARLETDRGLCHAGCQGDYVPSPTCTEAMPLQEIARYLQSRYYLARVASNIVGVAQSIVLFDIKHHPRYISHLY